ncbi:hypothetical protein DICPUDRAFT_48414 [Dictyostelium purpureum]|uniref:Uncharacterized protein n=1 Tax=Dictyostelium purpureum TaxID=5786 RepID=F0ZP27_DICPU|nr:uncharacterized protein DICPUDRAFT_48414 [Dictyostelium purpureum]EGC34287.1 hypothetical protein DICPUDRAFT_48414 [Dictyostelium purpureum]|eukprot:XP_003289169.1 hypothetical protein DICPUDRAFT_48414 [Dictyostelium purpureum]
MSGRSIFGLFGEGLKSFGSSLHKTGCKMQGDYGYVEKLNRHTRITPFNDTLPTLGKNSFIAPNASVIGDVIVGDNSGIWYNTVLRGDVNSIHIGNNSFIGDRCVVHCASDGPVGAQATQIGDKVYVGPGSIIHAATIQDEAYIGTGSIVLDGSVIQKNGFLESGSLLTGKTVKTGEVWGGSPAKFIRAATKEDEARLEKIISDNLNLSEQHEKQTSKSAKQLNDELLIKYTENRTKNENVLNTQSQI